VSEVVGDPTLDPDFFRYSVRCLDPACALARPVKTRYSESAQAVGEHHVAATGHKTIVERLA
jgi:hypothetical protein